MARIVQAFFQRRWVSLLPLPARSPDMLPIEHVLDMVGRRFIRRGPPALTLDALWTRLQTAWREIPKEHIQGLFDSMPRCIETLQLMEASHHIEITCSQIMYSSVILIVCLLLGTPKFCE